jgi:glycopeptide antibiotics resistance protein
MDAPGENDDERATRGARRATARRWPLGVPLWCWWIPLVWAISFPTEGLSKRAHWRRAHWIPFADPADKTRDVLANIALFLPFGYSFAGRRPTGWRMAGAVLAAGALSISAEATQLFSRSRFPSATDVSCAIIGAALGALWRIWIENGPP